MPRHAAAAAGEAVQQHQRRARRPRRSNGSAPSVTAAAPGAVPRATASFSMRVERGVRGAIDRHLDDVPAARERSARAPRETRPRTSGARGLPAEPRASAHRSSPCGMANSGSNTARHRLRDRQVLEDAAAVVVADDDREVRVAAGGPASSAGDVVQQREVAAPQHRGAPQRGGRAERGGDLPVDAVDAAVREHAHGSRRAPGERVELADRPCCSRRYSAAPPGSAAPQRLRECGVRKRGSAASASSERRARHPIGVLPRGGASAACLRRRLARRPARELAELPRRRCATCGSRGAAGHGSRRRIHQPQVGRARAARSRSRSPCWSAGRRSAR